MYGFCPCPEEMSHVAFQKVERFLGNPGWCVSAKGSVDGTTAPSGAAGCCFAGVWN